MEEQARKMRVLFVCAGNACRSQMAEAWARHLKSDCLDVYSAGIKPAGVVSGRTRDFMAEVGVDMSDHYSKGLDEWVGIEFDYVVALSEEVAECCPAFPESTRVICYPTPDPTRIIGSLKQVKRAFQKVSDMLKGYVESMPEILERQWQQARK